MFKYNWHLNENLPVLKTTYSPFKNCYHIYMKQISIVFSPNYVPVSLILQIATLFVGGRMFPRFCFRNGSHLKILPKFLHFDFFMASFVFTSSKSLIAFHQLFCNLSSLRLKLFMFHFHFQISFTCAIHILKILVVSSIIS
jgi:hypothetical protein